MRIIPHKKKKGLCVAHGCTNKHTPKNRFCSKHNHRYQKIKNPIAYTFMVLKGNAKRRGKPFELTLKQFEKFCNDTGYIETKGRFKNASSIDRIDPTKGYSVDNIRILSFSENSARKDCPF